MEKGKFSLLKLAVCGGFVVALLSGCGSPKTEKSTKLYSEDELGLRKTTLYDENQAIVQPFTYSKDEAGSSKVIERSFENAPPLISHSIEGMPEISRDLNMCNSCHLPEMAKAAGIISVPKTHLVNLRTGQDLKGALDDARYNCTQCHVPQAQVDVAVQNNFRPDFRNPTDKGRSNLIDNINEGVN